MIAVPSPDDKARLAEFHSRLDESLAQADRGDLADGEEFMRVLVEGLDRGAKEGS